MVWCAEGTGVLKVLAVYGHLSYNVLFFLYIGFPLPVRYCFGAGNILSLGPKPAVGGPYGGTR